MTKRMTKTEAIRAINDNGSVLVTVHKPHSNDQYTYRVYDVEALRFLVDGKRLVVEYFLPA
jgi:hypothetical protein